jgi:hypothetical protein
MNCAQLEPGSFTCLQIMALADGYGSVLDIFALSRRSMLFVRRTPFLLLAIVWGKEKTNQQLRQNESMSEGFRLVRGHTPRAF